MAKEYKVTVGSKANCFHDAYTGITVAKGEIVTLRSNQYNSAKIRAALSTGHLVLAVANEDTPAESANVDKLNKKIHTQYEKGVSIEKIASNMSMENAKLLAEVNEVSIDEEDTIVDILKAILED